MFDFEGSRWRCPPGGSEALGSVSILVEGDGGEERDTGRKVKEVKFSGRGVRQRKP